MMALKEGEYLEDFVGPLGCPSELCMEENLEETKKKNIVFIAGGLGTAPVYPQVKWLHEHGVDVDVIMGFRTKDIVFFEEEM
ncbi:NAD-binding oxidoreductase, partial [Acinetobacter baumannii]